MSFRGPLSPPPYHEAQPVLMTSASISGTHDRGNLYYSRLSKSLRLSPCRGGKVRGLGQLLLYPYLVAHPYSIGARQLYAVAAILRRPRSVRQDEAVGLQISLLPQKAGSVLALDLGGFWDWVSRGCRHTADVPLRELFPPFALRRRRYLCSQGWGRSGTRRDRDITRR